MKQNIEIISAIDFALNLLAASENKARRNKKMRDSEKAMELAQYQRHNQSLREAREFIAANRKDLPEVPAPKPGTY